jgi:hypothetical protein
MDLAWPTVNRQRKDASPNTITKVFIVLVITRWWMITTCVLCWTRETLRCRFSESVRNLAVDNVPLSLPPPACRCLVYVGKSRFWLDCNASDKIRQTRFDLMIYFHFFMLHVMKFSETRIDLMIYWHWFIMHVTKFGTHELISWFASIVWYCMWRNSQRHELIWWFSGIDL